jgi:hypothetical protein
MLLSFYWFALFGWEHPPFSSLTVHFARGVWEPSSRSLVNVLVMYIALLPSYTLNISLSNLYK